MQTGNSKGKAWLVTGILGILLIVTLFSLWFNFIEYSVLNNLATVKTISRAELKSSDFRQQTMAIVQLGVFFLAAIAFIHWFYSSYRNLQKLRNATSFAKEEKSFGGRTLQFINPVRAYQNMIELMCATAEGGEGYSERSAKLVVVWWLMFLAYAILPVVSLYIASQAGSIH